MRRRSVAYPPADHLPQLSGGRIPMAALIQTLAVAEHLSFYRAAQALGTSQSSVSTRIKTLEQDLGVVLFDRNTRGVRLTEAGRRFVAQVHDAMGILDRAVKTAGMQARGEDGELHVGVHMLTAGCFLDRLLERFHDEYPGIRLQISEGTARDAQFMVREGKLDLAFMAGAYELPDLNSRIIWRDRLMVALPAKHPLAVRANVEWWQLAEETFLVRHSGTGPQVHDLIVTRSAGRWLTPAIIRVDVGRSALLSMVAEGHGISLFAEESVAANTANVVFLPITDEPEAFPFSAVWSPANGNPALVTLLEIAAAMKRHGSRAESQP